MGKFIFDDLLEAIPGSAVVVDAHLVILKYNSKFSELSEECGAAGAAGLNEIFSDNAVSEIKKRINPSGKTLRPPLLTAFEYGSFRLDAEVTVKPLNGDTEENTAYLIYIDDISEKKRFEYELHNLLNVIDSSPASILVTDTNGAIQFVNQRFVEVTGYSKSEVLGKNPSVIKSGSQGENFYKDLWVTVLSGREWRGELHNRKKNGESFWEIASISPIKDRNGKIQNLIAVKEDITHLKRIEDELKISQEKNRVILEAIPDVMFRIDIEGRCLDTHVESKAEEVFPSDTRKSAMPVIRRAVDRLAVEVYEYPVYLDKRLDYFEARFIATDEEEILVIVRNITERVQVEEQIKKARDDAESANRSKSDFLASMSHEIRTPLNSIMGFIELLQRSGLGKTHSEYLAIVSRSAESLLGIINDILDFSKIESRKIEIEDVDFCPFTEFESVIDLFHARACEKKIDLISYVDPLMPAALKGDPLRIKQVLSNLLSNAVKFTHEGGYILIEVKPVWSGNGRAGIFFGVTDNGIGIPDRKKKTVFQAFGQADSSTTRHYGGTGLGLAISSNLVSLMGSTLELSSEQGKGSVFYFTLDMGAADQAECGQFDLSSRSLKAGVYAPPAGPGIQERVLMRYLDSFGCAPELVTHNYPPGLLVVIAVDSPEAEIFIREQAGLDPSRRFLLIRKNRNPASADEDHTSGAVKTIYQPVNASNLYDSLNEIIDPLAAARTSHTVYQPGDLVFYEADVLVAEDNPVNQKLIKLMLLEFGINADIASNGLTAYEMARAKKYSLIFMDVNMPVTDGIESTAMIIDYEKDKGLRHVPIIALTAKAIKGDREHLLASGMDDYLAKPVSIKSLGEALARHLVPINRTLPAAAPQSPEPAPSEDAVAGYDFTATAAILGIQVRMLKIILAEFLDASDESVDSIGEAISSNDMERLYQASHRLKGAAANLRIEKISVPSLEIETHAKNNAHFDYQKNLDDIKKELEILKRLMDK